MGVLLQDGRLLIAKSEVNQLPKEISRRDDAGSGAVEQRPRVAIDRITNGSNLYLHRPDGFRAGMCGLWFGVRWLAEP